MHHCSERGIAGLRCMERGAANSDSSRRFWTRSFVVPVSATTNWMALWLSSAALLIFAAIADLFCLGSWIVGADGPFFHPRGFSGVLEPPDTAVVHDRLARFFARREGEPRPVHAFVQIGGGPFANGNLCCNPEHVAAALCRPVLLLSEKLQDALAGSDTPDFLRAAIAAIPPGPAPVGDLLSDPATGTIWLLCAISPTETKLGVAVDLGKMPKSEIEEIKRQLRASLAEVQTTLDNLDIGQAFHKADLRAETDPLREAVIGSGSARLAISTDRNSLLGVVSAQRSVYCKPITASLAWYEAIRGTAQ